MLDKVRADNDRAVEESRAKGQAEYDKFSREAAELSAQAMERTGLPGSDIAAAALRASVGDYDGLAKMGSEPGKLPGGLGGADGIAVGTPKAGASIEKMLPGTGMLLSGSGSTKLGEGIDLDLKLGFPGFAQDGGRSGKPGEGGTELRPEGREPGADSGAERYGRGASDLASRPLAGASAEKRDLVADFIDRTLRH
ncbi:hypothetical protein [Streptomyces alboniger]|uniref:Uncharacterized protein n=1 Tax=Streptomyces alboniger TaxID=132473 RepID=A0A5J6HVS6_STRAD|nr:hypothetical protein [Streptomyces alboniger]QEV21087.1 hypothetical protein CP975_29200 [Streptomyces alboniger]